MLNNFRLLAVLMLSLSLTAYLAGCDGEESGGQTRTSSTGGDDHDHDHDDHDHDHGDDEDHDHGDHDHDGDDVSLGSAMIGDVEIEAHQGHGEAAAGKELHIVIELPYADSGATEVRVWIGTEDRFASVVEKAGYSADKGTYDAHAVAPDPLPENAAWWIEITQPDGSVHTGSIGLK